MRLWLAQADLIVENLRVFADPEAVAQAAADFLAEQISACVAAKDECHVALPGGSTPARCLELLAGMDLPWQNIHWYLGDERCYPVSHPERNDSMVERQLWSKIDAPIENRHPIPAQLGPAEAAGLYTALINRLDRLDIVMLGIGEDGHTASLFPGNQALQDKAAVVPVYDAPKPPPERVSLSLATLQSAGQRIVLVSGSSKHGAMTALRQGEPLPVNRIGAAVWFVDQAAYNNQQDIE